MNMVQAISPAKVILSGEHAVLHGASSLGVAIQKYCQTTIHPLDNHQQHFEIHIPELQCRATFTDTEMATIHRTIHNQLHKIATQEKKTSPASLIAYAIVCFASQHGINLNRGMKITIETNIPVASGMGSSAACLVSLMQALSKFFGIEHDQEQIAKLATEAESAQHGRSSGLDVYLSLLGGCLYYTPPDKQHITTQLPPITLLHSGHAQSSTRDCVQHCHQSFINDKGLASAFNDITCAIKQHLIDKHNPQQLKLAIQTNHRLLCRLGVVSDYVQDLIQTIEQQGGAAKISGSGSLTGNGCGIIWAVHHTESLAQLAKKHQVPYELANIHYHETSTSH
jgi:mevalonate kinase